MIDWINARKSQLKPTTWQSYNANLRNHVLPRLGERRLQDLNAQDLDRFYQDLLTAGNKKTGTVDKPLSPRTVRYIHAIIRRALQDALRKNIVMRNVATAADPPSTRPLNRSGAPRTWNAEQVGAFLAETRDDRSYPIWVIAFTTGMRRGEIMGVRWEDVDFGAGALSIHRTLVVVNRKPVEGTPKSGTGRLVSLAPETIQALRAWGANNPRSASHGAKRGETPATYSLEVMGLWCIQTR